MSPVTSQLTGVGAVPVAVGTLDVPIWSREAGSVPTHKYRCAFTRRRFDLDLTANEGRPLAHAYQAEARFTRRIFFCGVETFSVILYYKHNVLFSSFQHYGYMFCIGMFRRIIESFLRNAV